jgi:O-antigen ligase
MPQAIAALVFASGILGLLWLDRERKSRVSPALWIAVVWVSIGASRAVSQWLRIGPVIESSDQYLDGSPLDRLILTGLLAAGLVVLLTRSRRVGALLRANGPLLVLLLYCAVSVLWSAYPFVAFKRWTKALGNVVMVLVVLTDPDPAAAVRRLLARSAFLLVPLSVLFVKYYPDLGRGYNAWTWTPYYVGVSTNKNGLGAICLVFGLGSCWRFLEALRGEERPRVMGPLVAHGVVLALVAWLFWKANSATAVACFLIGAGLIAFTARRGRAARPLVVHVFAAGIVLISLVGVFLAPEVGLLQAVGRDPTLTGRTALWEEVLRIAGDPWFGVGFESFWLGERVKSLWEAHWWRPNEAHNGYLEIFLTLGWVGVALFSFVMAWGYRNVVRSLRRNPGLGRLRLAYWMVAVLYNVSEAAFKVMHPVWITFLLAVIVTPDAAPREDRRSPATRAAPSVRPRKWDGLRRRELQTR